MDAFTVGSDGAHDAEEGVPGKGLKPTSVAPLRSRWPIGVFTMSEMRT
jgi:hypothetical protein